MYMQILNDKFVTFLVQGILGMGIQVIEENCLFSFLFELEYFWKINYKLKHVKWYRERLFSLDTKWWNSLRHFHAYVLYFVPIHLPCLVSSSVLPTSSCWSFPFFEMFLSSASMPCAFHYPFHVLPRALPLFFMISQPTTHFLNSLIISSLFTISLPPSLLQVSSPYLHFFFNCIQFKIPLSTSQSYSLSFLLLKNLYFEVGGVPSILYNMFGCQKPQIIFFSI